MEGIRKLKTKLTIEGGREGEKERQLDLDFSERNFNNLLNH